MINWRLIHIFLKGQPPWHHLSNSKKFDEYKQQAPIALDNKKANKKTQKQEAIVDVLTAVVRLRADENSLNPTILASRKDLENLLLDETNSPLLQGWRYSMVGKELQGLLQGKYTLTLSSDEITLTENTWSLKGI